MIIHKIFDIHDIDVNQKYGDNLPYSFHLKAVVAQGKIFSKEWDYLIVKHSLGMELNEVSNKLVRTEMLEFVLAGHDLIEDARMTYNDVKQMAYRYFYDDSIATLLADIIYDVTDEKGKNRGERKNNKFYSALKKNELALFVKLADMAANRMYSKLFNTKQYNMYKEEFEKFKQKTYTNSLANMFNYVNSI